jgi:tyrosine-protein phosphatase YwqE
MIDIHSHILPGVDDGPATTLDEAVAIFSEATSPRGERPTPADLRPTC